MIKKIKSMGQNLKTTIHWPFFPTIASRSNAGKWGTVQPGSDEEEDYIYQKPYNIWNCSI